MSKELAKKITFEKGLSIENYLDKVIKIYSAVYMNYERWLTPMELSIYITYIINCSKGYKISSDAAFEEYKKTTSIKRKGDIHSYLSRLANKRWVTKEKRGYKLPEMFKKLPETFDFSITINKTSEIN